MTVPVHVSAGSGLIVDGEIVSWDLVVKDSVVVLIGGIEYEAVYTYDGEGFFFLDNNEAKRFLQRTDMRSVVYRCSFCLHLLGGDETVLCTACAAGSIRRYDDVVLE